jgi:SPP1 gp7 family putative phage head morphogenesis protein
MYENPTIAGLAALEQIRFVVDKLADVLEKGGTFKSFQDAVRAGGIDVNLPTHRLENIFRTNIQAAYSRGRWEQQMRARGSRPYLMYDAINDSRTRPAHAAMDNIIRRWDDPFWATNYPTNGYRCRCTVISLTEAQAKKRGGVTDPLPDPDTTKPDPGWDYNIGADYEGGPNRAIEKTVEKIKTKRPTTSKKADEAKEKIKKATKKAGPPTLDEILTEGQEALANMRTDPVGFNEDMEKLLMERVLGVKHGSTASNLKAIREKAREALKNLEIKAINLDRVSRRTSAT